jgi:hypothetical protein
MSMQSNNHTRELFNQKEYYKLWREKNREKLREANREYRAKNSDRIKEIERAYKEANPKKNYEQWHRNKERYNAAARERYKVKKDAINARVRERYQANKKQRNEYSRLAHHRKKSNPQYRMACNLRSRIRIAIKSIKGTKHAKTMELIGCSIQYLREHLTKQFDERMSWSNYGEWHIDHIRPVNTYDLTDPVQQRQCCHYSNLRPLWSTDNLSRPKDGRDIGQELEALSPSSSLSQA